MKRFDARLTSLEEAASRLAWADEYCEACGAPDSSYQIFLFEVGEEPGKCPECGRTLDQEGKPLDRFGGTICLRESPVHQRLDDPELI